jgi:hypothetical protein
LQAAPSLNGPHSASCAHCRRKKPGREHRRETGVRRLPWIVHTSDSGAIAVALQGVRSEARVCSIPPTCARVPCNLGLGSKLACDLPSLGFFMLSLVSPASRAIAAPPDCRFLVLGPSPLPPDILMASSRRGSLVESEKERAPKPTQVRRDEGPFVQPPATLRFRALRLAGLRPDPPFGQQGRSPPQALLLRWRQDDETKNVKKKRIFIFILP